MISTRICLAEGHWIRASDFMPGLITQCLRCRSPVLFEPASNWPFDHFGDIIRSIWRYFALLNSRTGTTPPTLEADQTVLAEPRRMQVKWPDGA